MHDDDPFSLASPWGLQLQVHGDDHTPVVHEFELRSNALKPLRTQDTSDVLLKK